MKLHSVPKLCLAFIASFNSLFWFYELQLLDCGGDLISVISSHCIKRFDKPVVNYPPSIKQQADNISCWLMGIMKRC